MFDIILVIYLHLRIPFPLQDPTAGNVNRNKMWKKREAAESRPWQFPIAKVTERAGETDDTFSTSFYSTLSVIPWDSNILSSPLMGSQDFSNLMYFLTENANGKGRHKNPFSYRETKHVGFLYFAQSYYAAKKKYGSWARTVLAKFKCSLFLQKKRAEVELLQRNSRNWRKRCFIPWFGKSLGSGPHGLFTAWGRDLYVQ